MKELLFILLHLVYYTQCIQNSDKLLNTGLGPVTITPSGIIHGAYNVTRLGRQFESYRGIRYAEPPVGALRFQPPKLIQKYIVPVNATEDGPVCPQSTKLSTYSYDLMDEDCLYMNVYTPLRKERTDLLPVVVYIHQGAFYFMTGRSDLCGPNYLLDQDIVLVTFNYRLGSLGFISTGDEVAPGNNGFKDQVTALRWVQKNIAAFGGDPNSVTLTGYSSGSTSVVVHLLSPMSKGLFHRAISMSGSPTKIVKTPTDLYDLAVKQAELLDCPTYNSAVIIDCLKTKPWKDFATTFPGFFAFATDPVHLWDPIVENDFGQERFLTKNPIDTIRDGEMNYAPCIISQNEAEDYPFAYPILRNDTLLRQINEEWDRVAPISFLLPEENRETALKTLRSAYIQDRLLYNDEESADRLGTLYGDSIIAFTVNRLINLMSRHSLKPVWYFEFTYVGNNSYYEDPVTGKPTRAVHQDETLYLFSQPYRFPEIGTTGEDAVIVERMTGIWYNFAKYGIPNPCNDAPEPEGLIWPTVTPDEGTYLRISNQFSLHQNLKEERMKIWDELYPIQY